MQPPIIQKILRGNAKNKRVIGVSLLIIGICFGGLFAYLSFKEYKVLSFNDQITSELLQELATALPHVSVSKQYL